MAKIVQNAFTRGQLDYDLMSRQDVQTYRKGASKLKNFIVRRHGGISKRNGFDRILDLTSIIGSGITASTHVRLIPFAYKKNQGFILVVVPNHMYAVDTVLTQDGSVSSVVRYSEVIDSASVYTTKEDIEAIDYQQCGDVLFLANKNHPPAKISHELVTNDEGEKVDTFTYAKCEFFTEEDGIPTVSTAKVVRTAATASGSTKTEEYRVSAVYDGKETYPSEVYKDANVQNNASEWTGTTYYLPWTDSQTINVTVKVPTKTINGVSTRPDKLMFYRKNFNYFGLIGTLDLNSDDVLVATLTNSDYINWNTKADSTQTEKVSPFVDATGEGKYGINRTGYEFKAAKTASLVRKTKTVNLKLDLGIAYKTYNGDSEVTFNYANWVSGTQIKMRLHTASAYSVYELPAPKTIDPVTYTQGTMTASAWETFVSEKFNEFVSSINDEISSVTVRLSATTATDQIDIVSNNTSSKYFYVNKITAKYTDSDTVTFKDKYYTPDSSVTPLEKPDKIPFNNTDDYPSSVSISQQRLVWASSNNDPARIWMSESGNFYGYSTHEVMQSDDPIDFILPITRFANISHITEMRKLLMFNSACEWMVDSSSSVSGITYSTIQAYPQSYSGSSDKLKPLICNNSVLFASRSCQEVRRFAWDLTNDGFAGKDVSIFSSRIFKSNPIKDWTYQQFPNGMIWMVLKDGTMASLTYMEEQDILAWGTHELGGGGTAVAVATTYAMSPRIDEIKSLSDRTSSDDYDNATSDEVFAAVKRGTSLWLERMRPAPTAETDSILHHICMDSVRVCGGTGIGAGQTLSDETGMTYVSSVKTTAEGVSDTLESRVVTKTQAQAIIDDGHEVYEGYVYDAEFVSVFPAIGNVEGAGQFDIKDIKNLGFRMDSSAGGEVAAYGDSIRDDDWEPIRYEDTVDNRPEISSTDEGVVTLHKCDCRNVKPIGINSRDGRVVVRQGEPWQFTILEYDMDVTVERGGAL